MMLYVNRCYRKILKSPRSQDFLYGYVFFKWSINSLT